MCATSDKNDSTTIFTLSNGDMKMNEQVENELEQFDNNEMVCLETRQTRIISILIYMFMAR